MKKRAKLDLNQKQIEKELKKLGYSVLSLASMGKGVPDLLIGKDGINLLVEIKNGKNKLTPDQIVFKESWLGNHFVCRTTQEILIAFIYTKSRHLWKI